MDSKRTLSITEARKKIFEIAEDVQKPGTHYTLTENGKPKVVILSYEEYDSLVESLEVAQEMPGLEEDIKKSREDYETGRYKHFISLEEILARQGFVLAEKAKKQYGLSSKTSTQSRKTTK